MAEPFDPETVRTALALYDSPPKSPWTAHEGHLVSLVAHWHDCGALPHLRALLAAHDAHGGEVEAAIRFVVDAINTSGSGCFVDVQWALQRYRGRVEPTVAAFQAERRTP